MLVTGVGVPAQLTCSRVLALCPKVLAKSLILAFNSIGPALDKIKAEVKTGATFL